MEKADPSQGSSYDFQHLAAQSAELERLRAQAKIAWNLEKTVLLEAGLRPGMRVLDLACGPGFITRRIASELVGAGGRVTGIDLSDPLLTVARRECSGLDNVEFLKADVYAPGLPENAFDFAYARFLFQHLQHPETALGAVRRLVKPGGTVLLVDADDGLLGICPEPAGFAEFTARAADYQAGRGGDRRVGRKLGCYLARSGFQRIAVRVVPLTSLAIPRRTLLDITTGFKVQLVPPEEREAAQRTVESIYAEAMETQAFVTTGVYVASGVCP